VHVSGWLAEMAKPRAGRRRKTVKWGPTYQNMALRTLVAAFNWAKGQGLISTHCLQNSKAVQVRNRKRTRGQEAYVPPATWQKLINCVSRSNTRFAALRRFLYATGCRPSEAFHVEARYYHAADRCVVYPGQPRPDDFVCKNARATGRTGSSSSPTRSPGSSRPGSRSGRAPQPS